jgi:hypothetical protein
MNTILKCLMLSIMTAMTGLGASAQTTEPYQPKCDHDQIESLVGVVAMSLGVERVVAPTMTCLLKLWREDRGGTTKYYESVAFLTMMEQNPQLFFAAMANEPKIFDEWLRELGSTTFDWPLDPPCPLETRRKQLITMLEHTNVSPGNLTTLKNAVTKKLSSIRCRQIS